MKFLYFCGSAIIVLSAGAHLVGWFDQRTADHHLLTGMALLVWVVADKAMKA